MISRVEAEQLVREKQGSNTKVNISVGECSPDSVPPYGVKFRSNCWLVRVTDAKLVLDGPEYLYEVDKTTGEVIFCGSVQSGG